MMDTLHLHAQSDSARSSRAHVEAEWRDKRSLLNRAALQGQAAVCALLDVAHACVWKGEADAVRATAHELCAGIIDGLSDALGPLHRRAHDAGLDPIDYQLDLSELRALHASLGMRKEAA